MLDNGVEIGPNALAGKGIFGGDLIIQGSPTDSAGRKYVNINDVTDGTSSTLLFEEMAGKPNFYYQGKLMSATQNNWALNNSSGTFNYMLTHCYNSQDSGVVGEGGAWGDIWGVRLGFHGMNTKWAPNAVGNNNLPDYLPNSGMVASNSAFGSPTRWGNAPTTSITPSGFPCEAYMAVVQDYGSGGTTSGGNPMLLTAVGQTNLAPPGAPQSNGDSTCSNMAYSFHPGGANVVMADGSVHFLSSTLTLTTAGSLISMRGDEQIGPDFN